MTARWITDAVELTALGPAWAALCDDSPSSSPFERPEWLLPWVKVFGGDARLRVLAIERVGALVGFIPLVETGRGDRDGPPHLGFLGTGVSDYHDAVLADDGPALQAEMWHALARCDWTTCGLDRLRPGSPLLRSIPAGVAGIGGDPSEQDVCPALTIPPGARTIAEIVPAGYAGRLARAYRRAARLHHLTFRVPSGVAEAEELFAGLARLHTERWNLRGEPGALAHEAVRRFHGLVIRAMWQTGLLRIFGLDVEGILAAVVYGFSVHGRMVFYLGAFDPSRASLSPGALLIAFAIERVLAEGGTVFDFLRGRESYKYRFGAVDRPCFTRTLRRLTAKRD